LIFHGVSETEEESCSDLVKHSMVSKLKIDQKKAKGTMFCGAHRLGKKKRSGNGKPRPIIVRFTCRADRDSTWRQRFNLKESSIRMAEDPPQNVREIRRKVHVPALKKARKLSEIACWLTARVIPSIKSLKSGKKSLPMKKCSGEQFTTKNPSRLWLSK